MTKIYCDFCSKEIDTNDHHGRPLTQETVILRNKRIGLQVSVFEPDDIAKRLTHDICRSCVFDALDLIDPRGKKPVIDINHIGETIYRSLRDYQDGNLDSVDGVAVGQLTPALTKIYDRVLDEMKQGENS